MTGSPTLHSDLADEPVVRVRRGAGGPRWRDRSAPRRPLLRLLVAQAALAASAVALVLVGDSLREGAGGHWPSVVLAPVTGLAAIVCLFWVADCVVEMLPARYAARVRPYVYGAPALLLVFAFLVYPVISTIVLSFRDAHGEAFVGLDNYRFALSDDTMVRSLRNTAGWIVIVPLMAVGLGLAFAWLSNTLRRGEALAKATIFMPYALSFVGAAVIWNLVYDWRAEGFGEQVGLLNGIVTALGWAPVPWKQEEPWNNLLLMVILIWIQTGFATVILSAAIKGVPDELLDAARVDGATELRVFRDVVVPFIRPTILVVAAAIVILTLKVFDIVYVMTDGQWGTEVIAERMIKFFFRFDDDGRGAAVAVFLFIAAIPIVIAEIRRARREGLA
jgi:alpha-glucoside transport system permease protein